MKRVLHAILLGWLSISGASGQDGADPPMVVGDPVRMSVWPQTNLFLAASVTGAKPITYRWFFNGEPVGFNSPGLQLVITNSGTITLTAENAFGTDSVTYAIVDVLPVGARVALSTIGSGWLLRAQVAPGTAETTVWFEWGVDTNYGNITAATNIPAGPLKTVLIAPPMDMGVYNVRVIASNQIGIAVSPGTRFVPVPVTASMEAGTLAGVSLCWFEQGYVVTNRALGLPRAGSVFKSEFEDTFYFMPESYSAPNAILVDSTNGGTLRLVTPAAYSKLSFLTSAGSGEVGVRCIIHHVDGTTQIMGFTSNDWFNGTNTAYTAKAAVAWESPLAFPTKLWTFALEFGNPRLYGRSLVVTNKDVPIREIELSFGAGRGHAAVFAVSGSTGGGFTPIPVTGFTQDMVVEAAFSGEPQVRAGVGVAGVVSAFPGVRYEVWRTDSLDSAAANWALVTNVFSLNKADLPFGPIDFTTRTEFFKVQSK